MIMQQVMHKMVANNRFVLTDNRDQIMNSGAHECKGIMASSRQGTRRVPLKPFSKFAPWVVQDGREKIGQSDTCTKHNKKNNHCLLDRIRQLSFIRVERCQLEQRP